MKVGFTAGDPNGIGIETIVKTFADDRMFEFVTPILYASEQVIDEHLKALEIKDISYSIIDSANKAKKKTLNVIDIDDSQFTPELGELSSEAGHFQLNH